MLWYAFADPDEVVGLQQRCVLELAHDGPHDVIAPGGWSARVGAGEMWWLRFSGDGEHRELVARRRCLATRAGAGLTVCGHPAGHAGGRLWSTVRWGSTHRRPARAPGR